MQSLNLNRINSKVDLFGRVESFFSATPPIWLFFILVGVLFLFALALFGRRLEMAFLLIVSATLSGAAWTALDTGSTLIRWLLLVLLGLNCLRLKVYPGTPVTVYSLYVLMGIGMIAFSDDIKWSLQIGGLLVMTTLAAISLADLLRARVDVRRIFLLYMIGISAWLAMGLITLPQIVAARTGRFSGMITSVPLFAVTGGLLLPIATWGVMRQGKLYVRAICAFMVLGIMLLLFASGERTGTYAGVLGSIPVLFRRRLGGVFLVMAVVGLLSAFGVKLAAVNQRQANFRIERFTSTDLSGRDVIWKYAIKEIVKSPFIGHGHGGDRAFGMKYHKLTHNAYLAIWMSTGIFGLLVYLAAFGVGLWQTARLMFHAPDEEIRDFGRVLFGLIIAELAIGMFETQNSPSNFGTISLVIIFVVVGRLTTIVAQEATSRQRLPAAAWPRQVVWVPRELLERSNYAASWQRPR